jgi:hypothetical protein
MANHQWQPQRATATAAPPRSQNFKIHLSADILNYYFLSIKPPQKQPRQKCDVIVGYNKKYSFFFFLLLCECLIGTHKRRKK